MKVKNDDPVALDVVKAANNIEFKEPNYNHGWRSLSTHNKNTKEDDDLTYQLICPYITSLGTKNKGSELVVEQDNPSDPTLHKIFICPGYMNYKLKYVIPMISLDAAHLNSEYKGTLYVATVKSGKNETLPIAFGLTVENENRSGWDFFLDCLKEACPLIAQAHPQPRCRPYASISLISDRDKGLLESSHQNFPKNHHSFCSVHLERNVKNLHGLQAGLMVPKIAKTFSTRQEKYFFRELTKIKPAAAEYVSQIEPTCWRSTCWITEGTENLPPRYGITTLNMSESINNMLKKARNSIWLYAMHNILEIIIQKIHTGKNKYKNKSGVFEETQAKIRNLYDESAGFKIIPTDEVAGIYKINRTESLLGEPIISHNLNVIHNTCTCGLWQEYNVPCVDAVAYLRICQNKSIDEIIDEDVSRLYTYEYLHKLYKDNLNAVALSTLRHDEVTSVAKNTPKRQPGRPKMLRYRERSKYENPADSKIKCQKCGRRGHNRAGCHRHPPAENTTQNRLSGNEIETGISETENENGPVTSSVTQSSGTGIFETENETENETGQVTSSVTQTSGTSTIFPENHDYNHEQQSE